MVRNDPFEAIAASLDMHMGALLSMSEEKLSAADIGTGKVTSSNYGFGPPVQSRSSNFGLAAA